MPDLIADDLFAGAGGWDLAAAQLEIHARGIENMDAARATRDAAGLETIHDDVWTFQPDGRATLKISSPPCQTFSAAGKGDGRKALEDVLRGIRDGYAENIDHLHFLGLEVGDERTALVLTPLHFALTGEYEHLAWEQVPAVLPVWEACAHVLRGRGWHVWTGLVHAEQYDVPQARKRAALIASRHHPVHAPTPTRSRFYSHQPAKLDAGVPRWISMAEGIGWGLVQRPSYTVTGGGGEKSSSGVEWGSAAVRNAMQTAADSGDPTLWAPRALQTHQRPNKGRPEYQERPVEHPAPTIASGSRMWTWVVDRDQVKEVAAERLNNQSGTEFDLGWPADRPAPVVASREIVTMPGANANRFNGSTKSRNDGLRITVEEAGMLQSFPADFPWQGNKGQQFLQAGNAVPVNLARALLEAATHRG